MCLYNICELFRVFLGYTNAFSARDEDPINYNNRSHHILRAMGVSVLFTQPSSHTGRFVNAYGADKSRGPLKSHWRDVTGARAPSRVTPVVPRLEAA